RSVDNEGNSRTITQNLLDEQSMGAEFTADYTPQDWWKMDVNLNLFYADIDGSNILESYKVNTYSWFGRYSSRFSLAQGLEIQLTANYEARQKSAQGERKALYYLGLCASKAVMKGRGTLILNATDIFKTRSHRYMNGGRGFYTVGDSQRTVRQINLSFNYRIKQSKQQTQSDILGD